MCPSSKNLIFIYLPLASVTAAAECELDCVPISTAQDRLATGGERGKMNQKIEKWDEWEFQ